MAFSCTKNQKITQSDNNHLTGLHYNHFNANILGSVLRSCMIVLIIHEIFDFWVSLGYFPISGRIVSGVEMTRAGNNGQIDSPAFAKISRRKASLSPEI